MFNVKRAQIAIDRAEISCIRAEIANDRADIDANRAEIEADLTALAADLGALEAKSATISFCPKYRDYVTIFFWLSPAAVPPAQQHAAEVGRSRPDRRNCVKHILISNFSG